MGDAIADLTGGGGVGANAGAGALVVSGAGVLTLSAANTYTGGTSVTGGATLVAAHTDNLLLTADSLGSGAVTLNGGSLRFTTPSVDVGGRNVITILGVGNNLAFTGGGTATLNAPLSGAGALTASTSGTLFSSPRRAATARSPAPSHFQAERFGVSVPDRTCRRRRSP